MDSVDELLQAARDETGLSDFGADTFREGLQILVSDLDMHGRLNGIGELALPGLVGKLLRNRLQIEDWYRRHPEIDEEQIVQPLVGLGLPRTGSTALAALLGEDPDGHILGRHHSTGIGRPRFWDRARYYNEEKRLAAALDAAEVATKV